MMEAQSEQIVFVVDDDQSVRGADKPVPVDGAPRKSIRSR